MTLVLNDTTAIMISAIMLSVVLLIVAAPKKLTCVIQKNLGRQLRKNAPHHFVDLPFGRISFCRRAK
jgi:hypothetical protein